MDIQLRQGRASDLPELQRLFYDTVQQVNCRDYNATQIQVWSSFAWDQDRWMERMSKQPFWLAIAHAMILGFTSTEQDGHIDLFFVHAQYQGQGVGSKLLAHLEAIAREQHLPRLYAEVSITARPFFERKGFKVVDEENVDHQGVVFRRYQMEKRSPI